MNNDTNDLRQRRKAIISNEDQQTPLPNDSSPARLRYQETTTPRDFRVVQRGVVTKYEYIKPTSFSLKFPLKDGISYIIELQATLPYLWRFIQDVNSFARFPALLFAGLKFLQSLLPSVTILYSMRFYEAVEDISTQKQKDPRVLIEILIKMLILRGVVYFVGILLLKAQVSLNRRLSHFVLRYNVECVLRLDLPTREDLLLPIDVDVDNTGAPCTTVITEVSYIASGVSSFLTQALLVWSFFQSGKFGAIVILSCILDLLIYVLNSRIEHQGPTLLFETNEHWNRLVSLATLVSGLNFHREILGEGLQEYIQQQLLSAQTLLGDTPLNHGYEAFIAGQESLPYILTVFLGELPLAIFAMQYFWSPSTLAPVSLAVFQQMSGTVSRTIRDAFTSRTGLPKALIDLKAFYEAINIPNQIKDGDGPFPSPENKDALGMEIEFKNVSFSYPRSTKEDLVLNELSFKIKRGQLCVIVGENGCGKSSTIKLLNRLYDVTSGSIWIDGQPLNSYRIADVRKATAIMHQDYVHLPMSVRENIGVGQPANVEDLGKIYEAARLGGAYDFVQKLPRGFDTVMNGPGDSFERDSNPWGPRDFFSRVNHPDFSGATTWDELEARVRNNKSPGLSGGQWQRLAIARTFMHTNNDAKLLAYDEPSAALDPKAEFELFTRLRDLRGQKTMIFITHRFGHLTKHADIILYMKEGKVTEQGTHQELLNLGQDYAHMYTLQAEAFL